MQAKSTAEAVKLLGTGCAVAVFESWYLYLTLFLLASCGFLWLYRLNQALALYAPHADGGAAGGEGVGERARWGGRVRGAVPRVVCVRVPIVSPSAKSPRLCACTFVRGRAPSCWLTRLASSAARRHSRLTTATASSVPCRV